MSGIEVIPGEGPVVLAQPHGGTRLPDDLMARLNPRGRELADTDWHIARLYDGLLPGATVVRATVHRYVIDVNRDPSGASLYPGQNTTGLCPVTDFDGVPIWSEGQAPSPDEIEARRLAWHAPYHAALTEAVNRARARHGIAVLYDCHSIRSQVPFLFDGTLPLFNIGTDAGTTCAPDLERAVDARCRADPEASCVLNGRFRGGWTTRHYGQPAQGIHAIQMELSQRGYMIERAPWTYRDDLAGRLRVTLAAVLNDIEDFARRRGFEAEEA